MSAKLFESEPEYLKIEGIDYVTDHTNEDERFLRNKIRKSLIPVIRNEYNHALVNSINRLTRIIRSEEEWIGMLIDQMFDDGKA